MINKWVSENLWCCTEQIVGRDSDWLRAGRSGDRIPVKARFSAPVQTVPGAHPAYFTMGTGSFPGEKSSQGVTLTSHPLLVPWSRKSRGVPLLPYGPYGLYRASVPVQGCTFTEQITRENFILSSYHWRVEYDKSFSMCRSLYTCNSIIHDKYVFQS